MTKPAPTLISQISKKHRDVVQKIFEHEGANLSRDEFFHWTEAERTTNTRRAKQAASSHNGLRIHLKNRFGCTDEEAEAMMLRSTYETNLLARGVARRILTGNPDELEAALALVLASIGSAPATRVNHGASPTPTSGRHLAGSRRGTSRLPRPYFGRGATTAATRRPC